MPAKAIPPPRQQNLTFFLTASSVNSDANSAIMNKKTDDTITNISKNSNDNKFIMKNNPPVKTRMPNAIEVIASKIPAPIQQARFSFFSDSTRVIDAKIAMITKLMSAIIKKISILEFIICPPLLFLIVFKNEKEITRSKQLF